MGDKSATNVPCLFGFFQFFSIFCWAEHFKVSCIQTVQFQVIEDKKNNSLNRKVSQQNATY